MKDLSQMQKAANNIVALLEPHCTRIQIAGSIRRKKPFPGDIEIVCIPKAIEVTDDLFDTRMDVSPEFIKQVNCWEKVKGEPEGKYTQRIVDGVKLDLFMATPQNWGYILAIRTGSAEYSHWVLAATWVRLGYKGVDGNLTREGKVVPVPEETTLFELLKLDFVEPENREYKPH